MLTFNLQKSFSSGSLNYKQQATLLSSPVDVYIDDIYSFSENGFYIGWGISTMGHGQYSMSYSDEKWHISNEGMGINSSCIIIDALEAGLRLLNDPKINYMIEKMKYNMSPECTSLSQGLTLIWNCADRDSDRNRDENNFQKQLTLGQLKLLKFSTEVDEYTNKNKEQIKNIACDFKFDSQYEQFGYSSLQKVINLDLHTEHYTTSSELNDQTLINIIKVVNELDINELQDFYGKEDMKNITKIVEDWKKFKSECNLPDSTEDIIEAILSNIMKTTNIYMKRLVR